MKRSISWVVVAAGLAMLGTCGVALAQNSQQTKMTSCNADAKAKGLSGADRQTFMKSCLSDKGAPSVPSDATAKPAAATPGGTTLGNSQQEKMKSCNADAKSKGLKGDDRKSYMKTCLSAAPGSH